MADQVHHRRFDDWIKTAGMLMWGLCAPAAVWLLVKLYGNLPEESRATREAVAVIQADVGFLKTMVGEVRAAQPVAEAWRERQVKLEARIERHDAEIVDIKQRVSRLEEERKGFFGGGKR